MENGDHRIGKKRKIDAVSPEEDNDDPLNLSLSLKPFVPRSPSPSLPPPPTSVPVYRPFSTSEIPRISPRPPPSIPVYLQLLPISTFASPIHSPQPPLLLKPVYRNLYPNETLNSPILPPPRPPPPPSFSQEPSGNGDVHPRPPRSRCNPVDHLPRGGKSLEIAPPYPWATNRRATVHSLQHLLSIQIHTITGDVKCNICERIYEMRFDLRQKSFEIFRFIIENKSQMYGRAPRTWLSPALPPCRFCGDYKNSVKPIISDKKKTVNWLFLFLGKMLGFCTLDQLKYFCKHTKNHRTGAKDRVLYLTYIQLCKQLDPNVSFHR